jgi:dTMP kinase
MGYFITFEGMDGSGKTTQVQHTAEYLRRQGHNVLLTREPGGTLIGDRVRELLMSKSTTGLNARAELLLFCASRAQLVDEVIRPHLAKGGVVLCDRYIDSSIAYQGYGHGLPIDALVEVIGFATGHLLPDLTIYLDITPQEGLRRRAAASLFGEALTRIDDMALDFHHRVYQGYADLGQAERDRWLRVDAGQSPEAVQGEIVAALGARLPRPVPG